MSILPVPRMASNQDVRQTGDKYTIREIGLNPKDELITIQSQTVVKTNALQFFKFPQ